MLRPTIYQKHNILQHETNYKCLLENIDNIVWKCKDRILDVGSGDGSFTANILKRFLPDDFKEMIGFDKSKEMVEFATKHYASERIHFDNIEIGKNLPEKYIGYFGHVFSFYTFHWIQDQRKAFFQIYDLLKSNGDCLMTINSHVVLYDVWRIMAKSRRWAAWMKEFESIVSPYHDCDDPVKKITEIMTEVGFTNIIVTNNKIMSKYLSVEDFKVFVHAITVFNIPEEQIDEYLEDVVKITQQCGYFDEQLTLEHGLLFVYGKK